MSYNWIGFNGVREMFNFIQTHLVIGLHCLDPESPLETQTCSLPVRTLVFLEPSVEVQEHFALIAMDQPLLRQMSPLVGGGNWSVITCFTFALYADFFRPCEDKLASLDEAAPQQEREQRAMKLFRTLLDMYERLAGNKMSKTPRVTQS